MLTKDEINELGLSELKELRTLVTDAIATFESRRDAAKRKQIIELLEQNGYTASDIASFIKADKSARPSVMYRNPANPSQTWVGKGKRPNWFNAALESGKTKEDMVDNTLNLDMPT